MADIVKQDIIEKKIFLIRGLNVMLDRDLAELYGVTTGNLNKAVNRNLDRFPDDFMFRLTKKEFQNLRFHSGISNLRFKFETSSCGGIPGTGIPGGIPGTRYLIIDGHNCL